ncbi:MAG: MOSC domain-containing protein [Planctomycetes bacterium]|nr:MOSC domain-containing protein [Planctomycetota bacterium]
MNHGRVIAVCLGPGGIPKLPVPEAQVELLGLVGDKHRHPEHGGANRAVCLLSTADHASLRRDGVQSQQAGSFGENLLIEGMDFEGLKPGDRLSVGNEVVLEIHDCREPCITLQPIDPRFPALMEGRSGFMCRVIATGSVATGALVSLLSSK